MFYNNYKFIILFTGDICVIFLFKKNVKRVNNSTKYSYYSCSIIHAQLLLQEIGENIRK